MSRTISKAQMLVGGVSLALLCVGLLIWGKDALDRSRFERLIRSASPKSVSRADFEQRILPYAPKVFKVHWEGWGIEAKLRRQGALDIDVLNRRIAAWNSILERAEMDAHGLAARYVRYHLLSGGAIRDEVENATNSSGGVDIFRNPDELDRIRELYPYLRDVPESPPQRETSPTP